MEALASSVAERMTSHRFHVRKVFAYRGKYPFTVSNAISAHALLHSSRLNDINCFRALKFALLWNLLWNKWGVTNQSNIK